MATGGIWKKGERQMVYRLPDLQEHSRVVLCEGVKDADNLWRIGIPATTVPMGAGGWRDEYASQLATAGAAEGHAYDVGACVRWIRQRDRAQHERTLAAATAASGVDKSRARKWAADAQRAEFDLRKREGEVVLAADVARRWGAMVVEARTSLLGVPTRLRGRRPALADADLRAVDDLIREALEGLADRQGKPSTQEDPR